MKLLRLVTLGGAASAVQPLTGPRIVRRQANSIITSVIYATSTYTITKCAASVSNCPASSTVVETSTTVMSITTTICPLPTTSGYPVLSSEIVSVPPMSSALPIGSSVDVSVSVLPPSPTAPVSLPGATGSLTDTIPTSFSPGAPESSNNNIPPETSTSTLSTGSSADFQISIIPGFPTTSMSLWVTTGTESIPTSFLPGVSGSSGGYIPPQPSTSALPTGSLTDSVPTSFPPIVSGSSSGYTASTPSGALPTVGLPSSGINTNTDAIYSSKATPSSGYAVPPASSNIASSATDATPTSGSPSSSAYITFPGSTSSSAPPSNTNTDSIPTSFPAYPSGSSSAGLSSSGYLTLSGSSVSNTGTVPTSPASLSSLVSSIAAPTEGASSSGPGSPSEYPSLVPSGSLSTISGTQLATTSTSSGYAYPTPPAEASSSVIDGTTRITSYRTQTMTSIITAQPSVSNGLGTGLNTESNTQALPTSRPSGGSALPSGSGYPYPSGSANGTIVAPKPSYVEIPINMGQVIGAGKSSVAAIVVALAFAHFA